MLSTTTAVLALGGSWASVGTWAAAGDATSGFDAGTLGQYGVLGLVNLVLFRFAQQAYNREKDRADAADAEVKRLNEKISSEYTDTLREQVVAANKNITALEANNVLLTRVDAHLIEEERPAPRRRA